MDYFKIGDSVITYNNHIGEILTIDQSPARYPDKLLYLVRFKEEVTFKDEEPSYVSRHWWYEQKDLAWTNGHHLVFLVFLVLV